MSISEKLPQSGQNAQTETNGTTGEAAGSIVPTSGQQMIFLTNKQLLGWGAGGGVLSVLAAGGLFDINKLNAMINGSDPETQILTYVVFAILISIAGAFWALAHKPISSITVAIQLGVMAPAAITALIGASTLEARTVTDAGMESSINLNVFDGIFVSSAYANYHTRKPKKPSTFNCFVKALIKQSC